MAQALAQLRQSGVKATGMQVDITVIEEIDALMEAAVRELGCLDIVVNNAGTTARCPFLDVTPEIFDRIYAINVRWNVLLRAARRQGDDCTGTRQDHQHLLVSDA